MRRASLIQGDAGGLPEFLGRLGEGGRSDVVTPDHEVTDVRLSGRPRNGGKLGDKPGTARQAAFHGGQPHRDRRPDASKRSNQPEADAMTTHEAKNLWAS